MEAEIVNINNKKYAIIKEINDYVYLTNVDNTNDLLVLKNIKDNDHEYLESLKSDEELNQALLLFNEKK